MAAPINNDNLAKHLLNPKSHRPEEQGRGNVASSAVLETTAADEDAISVSRAAEVLNQRPVPRSENVLETPEQAAEMARGLKALFEANPGQVLVAQTRDLHSGLGELLRAG